MKKGTKSTKKIFYLPETEAWNKEFGKRLRARREELDLSQMDVSARCGIFQAHISQLERGTVNPQVATVLILAKALNVKPEYFLIF